MEKKGFMRITGGLVYTPSFRFEEKEVWIRDGIFAPEEQNRAEAPVIDASGCYVIPGLIDIHFHGCMGMDFCDGTPEALQTIAAWEARQGVTAICPATLTLPPGQLKAVRQNGAAWAAAHRRPELADLVGINMEGPFISQRRRGAQNGAYILPCDAELAGEFVRAGEGLVKIIGLAPEENPDFAEYISRMKDRVRISLAHTDSDYDTAMQAFQAGASHAVHLCNAMPEMTHRAPGVIGAVRDCPWVSAELICDGNHVHPAVVRALFDMIGPRRLVLISDSLRAAGLGDGKMLLGGQEVEVHGTRATLTEGGNLAGSVVSLMQCLRIVVKEMGIPLEDAVRCATSGPARVIGVQQRYGSIEAGRNANLVLLEKETLEVRGVVKDGVRLV